MYINQINPFSPIAKLKFNDPCKVVAKFWTFVEVLRGGTTNKGCRLNINQINPLIPIPKLKFNDPCKVVAKFWTFAELLRVGTTSKGCRLWAIDALEKRLTPVPILRPGMLLDIFKKEVALLQRCEFDNPILVRIKASALINAVDRRVSQQEREQLSALLGYAVKQQAEISVRLMIGCGVDVNIPSQNNRVFTRLFPLIEAANRNDNEMVRLLLRNKADPKVRESGPRAKPMMTPLLLALQKNKNGEMISDLLDADMQMTGAIPNNSGNNWLHYICSVEVLLVVHDKLSKGNLDSYKAFLKKTNDQGQTPVECWQSCLNFFDPRLEALKRDLQNWGVIS